MQSAFFENKVIRILLFLLPISLGIFAGGAGAWAINKDESDPVKSVTNPHAGMSDDERSADIARIKALNHQWLLEFIDSGRDPRSLPVANAPTFSAGAATVDDARAQLDLVVEATVVSVTFVPDPARLTDSRASLLVEAVHVGGSSAQIEVLQVGGPARFGGDGELQQLEGDPLLLAGDRVLLLLYKDDSGDAYRTVYGIGVMRLDDGRVYPRYEDGPLSAQFRGLPVAEAVALLR